MSEKKIYVGPGRDSHAATMLREVGDRLFGKTWQSDLARALTPLHPKAKRVTQQMVARWAGGERTIPAWIWSAILDVVYERNRWFSDRYELFRTLAGIPPVHDDDDDD